MVKYSIVIPLYNKEDSIRRAIDSVFGTGYADLEIIVVDDGSTDNSAARVTTYTDPRLKYLFQSNSGVSAARNRGILEAQGEWILLLDADDEIMPEAMATYDAMTDKFPHAEVLVQRIAYANQPDRGLLTRLARHIRPVFQTRSPFFAIWANLCYPRPDNFCFKKKLCLHSGLFDERMAFWEDFDFTRRIVRQRTMAVSTATGAKYIQATTGLSRTPHPAEREMAHYIPEIIDRERTSFWERALLYDIVGHHVAWWEGHGERANHYRSIQQNHFPWYFKRLSWLRHQLSRHGII